LGVGDWGLGIGDWTQSPIPNPQSPIPNPQFLSIQLNIIIFINYDIKINKLLKNLIIYKMDNFKFQIQSLKSQIDNIKLQLSNIEMQYNNIFGSNPSDQLLNLSIQILNTGVQAFNTGKKEAMLVSDNYYDQLKNISSLINTILDQQKMYPMMQQ